MTSKTRGIYRRRVVNVATLESSEIEGSDSEAADERTHLLVDQEDLRESARIPATMSLRRSKV